MVNIFETIYDKLPRLPCGEKGKRNSGCDTQKLRKLRKLCRKNVHSCKMPNPFAVTNVLHSDVYPHPLRI